MKSSGCAEKCCRETGIGGVEIANMEIEKGETNPQTTPQVELGAPVCHPTEKIGTFEKNLENLRLKRQSLVLRDSDVDDKRPKDDNKDYKCQPCDNNDTRRMLHPLGVHDGLEEEEEEKDVNVDVGTEEAVRPVVPRDP